MSTHGPDLAYVAPGLPLKFSAGRGLKGAMALLKGETAGMALDFTGNGGLGYAAVKGHTTNLTNVPVDQFLTQSGTSPKLVLGADGLYHWSPHNLVPWSQDFDNAAWTKNAMAVSANAVVAPDGTMTADAIKETAVTDYHQLYYSNVPVVGGDRYTFRCWVKMLGRQWIYLNIIDGVTNGYTWFDLTNGVVGSNLTDGTATITAAGNGWWEIKVAGRFVGSAASAVIPALIVAAADLDQGSTVVGDITKGFYIWGAQLNRGPVATAYHATTASPWFGVPIEYGGGYYALVEPQATNLVLQSSDIVPGNWVAFGTATKGTADGAVAPDGTLTADAITLAAATDQVYQTVSLAASTTYTISAFVKRNAGVDQLFRLKGAAPGGADSPSADFAATASWQRFSYTFTVGGAGIFPALSYMGASTGAAAALLVWGFQVEVGPVATSPIPTFAATVTRAGDKLEFGDETFPNNDATGTWLVDHTPYFVVGSGAYIIAQAALNTPILYHAGVHLSYFDGTNNPPSAQTMVANARLKAANGYSGATAALASNGIVETFTFDGGWSGASDFRLGNFGAGYQLLGRIHTAVFVPRRMTDAELVARTT